MAKVMIEEGRSAMMLLLVTILQEMPLDDRRAIVKRLGALGSEEGQRAHLIAKTTVLNYGEAVDLRRAVDRLRGRG